MKRTLVIGFVLWLGATLLIRLAPARLLQQERAGSILILYAASFGLMFFVVRRFVAGPSGAPAAIRTGVALLLPTLVLDAFAAAFFPAVYPNFAAGSAGVFGGWMLISCGGGLAAVIVGK